MISLFIQYIQLIFLLSAILVVLLEGFEFYKFISSLIIKLVD